MQQTLLTVSELYLLWEDERTQSYRPPDLALIASLEALARAQGVHLEDVALLARGRGVPGVRKPWNPDLHPRGRDGKFIETWGFVSVLWNLLDGRDMPVRGQVVAISPDPKWPGNPNVTVSLIDPKTGKGSDSTQVFKPIDIEAAPAKARLPSAQAEVFHEASVPEAPGRAETLPMTNVERQVRQRAMAKDGVDLSDGVDEAEAKTMKKMLAGSTDDGGFTWETEGIGVRHYQGIPMTNRPAFDEVNIYGRIEPTDYDTEDNFYYGDFRRRLLRREGEEEWVVHNELLDFPQRMQGQGVGTEFTQHYEDYWIAHGIKRIDVHAGMTVGGYAWARAGFGWNPDSETTISLNRNAARYTLDNIVRVTEVDRPDVAAQAREMRDKFVGDDPTKWPTPFEISELGRRPDDVTWPGKEMMIYNPETSTRMDWYGTKFLPSMVPEAPGEEVEALPMADIERAARRRAYANDGVDLSDGITPDEAEKIAAALSGETKVPKKRNEVEWDTRAVTPKWWADKPGTNLHALTLKSDFQYTDAISLNARNLGSADRTLRQDTFNGKWVVTNTWLTIDGPFQGQGIGTEYTQQWEDYWIAHGVHKMQVHAALDVGGYAWARAGYTWPEDEDAYFGESQETASEWLDYIIWNGDEYDADDFVIEEAKKMLAQVKAATSNKDLPTPFEISELGREEGDEEWIGKAALMGSDWYGEKILPKMPVEDGGEPLRRVSLTELPSVLPEVTERRVARNEANGLDRANAFWSKAVVDQNTYAFETMATRDWDRLGNPEPSTSPTTELTIDSALGLMETNPKIQAAQHTYGDVPVVPFETLPLNAQGIYLGDVIAVADPVEPVVRDTLQTIGPRFNIDTSMYGTLRHEYGHHVHSMLPEADRARWQAAVDEWGGELSPDGVNDLVRQITQGEMPPSVENVDWGLSLYGRSNVKEAFAETFALVTHPDYKSDTVVSPRIKPLVALMEEFIARQDAGVPSAPVLEEAVPLDTGDAPLIRTDLQHLPDAMLGPVARRLARNARNGNYEDYVYWSDALRDDDRLKFGTFSSRMHDTVQWHRPEFDPEKLKEYDDAIAMAEANPKIAAAQRVYGEIPIVPFEDLPNNTIGIYQEDTIAITTDKGPNTNLDMNHDVSVYGTLRHEYGHHVQSMLSDADLKRWQDAYDAWGGGLTPDEVNEVVKEIREGRIPDDFARGLTLYGRTYEKEGFGEVFALVTDPDYNPDDVDPRIKPMVDLMEEFIAREPVPPAPSLEAILPMADVERAARRRAMAADGVDLSDGINVEESITIGKTLSGKMTVGDAPYEWNTGTSSREMDEVLDLIRTNTDIYQWGLSPKRIGGMDRTLKKDEGTGEWVVDNNMLMVNPEYQGQGVGTELFQYFEDYWIAHGVSEMRVHATLSVGGYAWARMQYDWSPAPIWRESNRTSARRMLKKIINPKLDPAWDGHTPVEVDEDLQRQAQAMLDRVESSDDVDEWPTPFDISELGRKPGMEDWPGKRAMLGSSWDGVKHLPKMTDDQPEPEPLPMLDIERTVRQRSMATDNVNVTDGIDEAEIETMLKTMSGPIGDGFSLRFDSGEYAYTRNGDPVRSDLSLYGVVLDDRGIVSGKFTRNLVQDKYTREWHVWNAEFAMAKELQGQGIGTEATQRIEDYWIAHGISDVRVQAGGTVGGYAWARAGFGWDPSQFRPNKKYVQDTMVYITSNTVWPQEVRDRAKAMWEQAEKAVDVDELPTPYEISELGRDFTTEILGDDMDYENLVPTWAGKSAMLTMARGHKVWQGAKTLPPMAPAEPAPAPDILPMIDVEREIRQRSMANDGVNLLDGVDDAEAQKVMEALSGETVIPGTDAFGEPEQRTFTWKFSETETHPFSDGVYTMFRGWITGPDGEGVGTVTRRIMHPAGEDPYISNAVVYIAPGFTGQGIGTELTQHIEDYWIAHDVHDVRVQAGETIGGYAWARAGFGWDPDYFKTNQTSARWMLREVLDEARGDKDVISRAKAMSARVRAATNVDDMPTPFEISELGRKPGDTTWPGKRVMMGSQWSGKKTLPTMTPQRPLPAVDMGDLGLVPPATSLVDLVRDPGEGGFTFDPRAEKLVTSGFSVATPGHGKVFDLQEFDDDDVAGYVDDNWGLLQADPDLHVGAWLDTETGQVWLDLPEVLQDRDAAIAAARERGELAIYDLNAKDEIRVGYKSQPPSGPAHDAWGTDTVLVEGAPP